MSTLRQSHSSGNLPSPWDYFLTAAAVATDSDHQTNRVSASGRTSLQHQPPPRSTATNDSPTLSRRTMCLPLPPRLLRPAQAAVAVEASCSVKGTKKLLKDEEDPFLAAFMVCTKSSKNGQGRRRKSLKKKVRGMRVFSCKIDSGVRDDGVINGRELKKLMEKEV